MPACLSGSCSCAALVRRHDNLACHAPVALRDGWMRLASRMLREMAQLYPEVRVTALNDPGWLDVTCDLPAAWAFDIRKRTAFERWLQGYVTISQSTCETCGSSGCTGCQPRPGRSGHGLVIAKALASLHNEA